jgi:hypothetical protein
VDSTSTQDTTAKETISMNATHEVLVFESGPEGTRITAAVDSFTPASADVTNPATQFDLHPQISAVLAANMLTINTSDSAICNPINSALLADIRNLVVPFPDSLTPGLSWKDSVKVDGCQAGIPTSSQITRSFMVKGEVPTEGRMALEVVRSDTASLNGEGGLQRHRASIRGVGTATGVYDLDVKTGQILRLNVNQVLTVDVLTLATKSRFQQRLTQEFVLSR